MDEYVVNIDELHDDAVVLAVPALCLLVFGRTMDEALNRARDSIRFRLRESGHGIEPAITFAKKPQESGPSALIAA